MSRLVHFDIDPGCDDAVMLAMALGLDGIEVAGISTVAGNSTIENTTRNALSILELGGRTDIPVARGCGRPLVDDLETAEWVHGEGGLRGALSEPSVDPVGIHGAEFIVEQVREHGDALTIAAVGPLTNLAIALAMEPALPELVQAIDVMGGAALGPGNVTPMAEANFYNDPASAARVCQDARPRLVGLDVTNRATIPPDVVAEYRAAGGVLGTVGTWLDYPEDVVDFSSGEGSSVHDAAVVAAFVDDAVLDFEPYHVEIDTTGGPSHGAVVCDYNRVTGEDPTAEVALDIDTERFRTLVRTGVEGFAEAA